MNIRKKYFLLFVVGIPLILIFLAFFNPSYAGLVRGTIVIFTVLAVMYSLTTKDPRRGLCLFFLMASMLEGPWKNFTYGTSLKFLVYIIRDLILYATFINFMFHKNRIVGRELLKQKPPFVRVVVLLLSSAK